MISLPKKPLAPSLSCLKCSSNTCVWNLASRLPIAILKITWLFYWSKKITVSLHIRIISLKVIHTLSAYAHSTQKNIQQKKKNSTGRKVYYLLLHIQNTEKSNNHAQFMQTYYVFSTHSKNIFSYYLRAGSS